MSPWGRDRLTDRKRLMFALRAAEGLSFRQTGERFGVSPERARQLIKRYCHAKRRSGTHAGHGAIRNPQLLMAAVR